MDADKTPLPYYAMQLPASHFSDPRHTAIAEAAYSRAERRGFAPGHELEDWSLTLLLQSGKSAPCDSTEGPNGTILL